MNVPTKTKADTVAVANRLRPVLLKLARELRRELHGIGVTGGQVSLLVAIRHSPGIGVGELAALERVSKPSISGAIDKLEQMGLVARAPHGGGDRRRVGLTVTAEGDRVLRSVKSKRTAWLANRLGRLTDDELAAVDAAVEPLLRLLEDVE
jgi:DNA-binding MarR family transcriptional regulator